MFPFFKLISQDKIRVIFLGALILRNKLHRDSVARIVAKINGFKIALYSAKKNTNADKAKSIGRTKTAFPIKKERPLKMSLPAIPAFPKKLRIKIIASRKQNTPPIEQIITCYADQWKKEFTPDCVVLTLGKQGSLAYSDKIYKGRSYPVKVVNRMGAGDAFDAGFIYGYLRKGKVQAGLEYGSAMAALKHTIPTNISIFSVDDVELIMRERVDIIR